MNTPQIVFVAGHEMGHYVLEHIPKRPRRHLLSGSLLSRLSLDRLGARALGREWGIRGSTIGRRCPRCCFFSDLRFLANPVGSAVSRYFEHQADQYGLEVTHGLTPDSGQVAAQAFQILGEVDLSDPNPNPVDVLFFYSHPAVASTESTLR